MLEITFTCPMCGRTISANDKLCPECGEPTEKRVRRDDSIDRIMSFTTIGIGAVVCLMLLVQLEPSLKFIGALMAFGWLFGPPLTCVAWYQSGPQRSHPASAWRIFWRVQAVMHALTFSMIVLCLGVCTPSSFH